MQDGKTLTARSLIATMRRLHRTLRKKIFHTLVKDIKPSPLIVLTQLVRAAHDGDGERRVSEVAAEMGISVAGATQIITALEKQGLVERQMDPEDRRAVLVSLTEEGRKVMEPALQELEQRFFGLIEHLGEENSRQLVTLLEEVERYFEK